MSALVLRRAFAASMASAVLLVGGCASYYKVTDPGSGKVYYTENVNRVGSATRFKDAGTGAEVTIQNSEIIQVNKDEFLTNRGGKK
jgi:hypothetical protein